MEKKARYTVVVRLYVKLPSHQSDWFIDYLTLAGRNNPARGQKEGDIRPKNQQETERETKSKQADK